MKNLYKQLNDIDIDVSKFEEIEVTEYEKAQYKKDLKIKVSKLIVKKFLEKNIWND